jgi:hypothetical protein
MPASIGQQPVESRIYAESRNRILTLLARLHGESVNHKHFRTAAGRSLAAISRGGYDSSRADGFKRLSPQLR